MFASEVATFENSPENPPEQQEQSPQEQPPQLPVDAQQVLNILGTGSLEQFVSAYIQILREDSNNLTTFLNQLFQSQDSNIFEFLFNAHKANSQKEWGVKTFFVTIMNIGLTIKDQGSPNVYHYLLLTSKDKPSPIYGLVQQLEPTNELNDHFIAIWNSMFGNVKSRKKSVPESKKENFLNKLGMGTLSKNSRVTIILTIIALFTILTISAGYFVKKYGGDITPNIEAPKPIKLPLVVPKPSIPIEF